MNTLIIIWLAINAIIGLPVIGFAIYCKVKDLRSKKSGAAQISDRQTKPTAALELKEATYPVHPSHPASTTYATTSSTVSSARIAVLCA